ncbi:hypothetical protein BCL69_10059 [Nitrosomonas communis]|uniref:Integrase catalytic domain-containing protein n=1 Tax=Nitrosomonas communis TaxID=44574 RepID=A0A5D3YJX5_9PROT|nr:hypothetical protein BCL69_10059 [Nitrosomonas communis]
MIGKNHQGVLVTLAKRKSRYILEGQLPAKHAQGVLVKINSLLRPHKHKCYAVTFDKRRELAGHEIIAQELEADIYFDFAPPNHSWEKGLNENSNGLLQRYFPKMRLTGVTEEQVQWAVDNLNH